MKIHAARAALGPTLGAILIATAAGATAAFVTGGSRTAGSHGTHSAAGVPAVVVELFTSEGCSSCPPADAVLANLTRSQPVPGAHIIGLEEHVDYWNGASWRDPFSSAAFSQRQSAYAEAFHNSQVYTPQMIVDGAAEFVGSDDDRARVEVERATHQSQGKVQLVATPSRDGTVGVDVRVADIPKGIGSAMVLAALTEEGLSSRVTGGENGGRKLPHTSVARTLEAIGTISSGGEQTFHTTLPLPAHASLSNCHVVVFVQKADNGRIIGAADAALGE